MMLRWLMAWVLRLTACFALIGGLVAREWGWREYASNELYLVYTLRKGAGTSESTFLPFIINADGRSEEEELLWNEGEINRLDCSPDGRTFGFLIDNSYLYVVNEAGIMYERRLDQLYPGITDTNTGMSVTNSGLITLYKVGARGLIVDARGVRFVSPPDNADYRYFTISSSGVRLWYFVDYPSIKVFSSDGELVWFLQNTLFIDWLPSEEDFIYSTYEVYDQNFADLATKITANRGYYWGALSPDGTKIALYGVDQIAIADYLQRDHFLTLPYHTRYDDYGDPSPSCFLTFRPEMLIDESQ